MSIVYIHRNLLNGKVYIGQTKDTLERRSRKDGSGYQGCHHFYHAIQQYGWENFSHAILEKDIDETKIDERERFWIQFFNSDNRDFGYNIMSSGGKSATSKNYTRGVYCKETGQYFNSLSDAAEWGGLQRTSMNDISKQIEGKRISAGKHPDSGIPLHWCLKQEEITSPNKIRTSHNAQSIINVSTGEVYVSINEAIKNTKISYPSIKKSCDSKGTIPVKNTYWMYLEDYQLIKEGGVPDACVKRRN